MKRVDYSLNHIEWSAVASVWRFTPEVGTVLLLTELPAILGAPDAKVLSILLGKEELLVAPSTVRQFFEWYQLEYRCGFRVNFPPLKSPDRLIVRCEGYIAQVRIFGEERPL